MSFDAGCDDRTTMAVNCVDCCRRVDLRAEVSFDAVDDTRWLCEDTSALCASLSRSRYFRSRRGDEVSTFPRGFGVCTKQRQRVGTMDRCFREQRKTIFFVDAFAK